MCLQVGIIRGAPLLENGVGTANTSLVFHAGRLLALHEGDLPYQVRQDRFGYRCISLGDLNWYYTDRVGRGSQSLISRPEESGAIAGRAHERKAPWWQAGTQLAARAPPSPLS